MSRSAAVNATTTPCPARSGTGRVTSCAGVPAVDERWRRRGCPTAPRYTVVIKGFRDDGRIYYRWVDNDRLSSMRRVEDFMARFERQGRVSR